MGLHRITAKSIHTERNQTPKGACNRRGGLHVKRRLAILVCALLLLVANVSSSYAVCNHYAGLGIASDPEYGNYCGGYGGGCTECVDEETYQHCVTNGASCEPGPYNQR